MQLSENTTIAKTRTAKTKEAAAAKNTLTTINSRFGEITVNLEKKITFPHGLLGIPGKLGFYLAEFPDEKRKQFKILQSAEDETLAFIVLPADPENSLITKEDMDEARSLLDIEAENLLILLIVTVHRTPEKVDISVNLRAPVMVDAVNRVATQFVFQNSKYEIRYMLT